MSFHMRRTDRQITDLKILKKILKTTQYVTIALSKDNQPYLVSLSHGYDENKNCVYFHCGKIGKKLEFIKANDRIWGQAVLDFGYSGECHHRYTSVQFSGRASFLEKREEKLDAMACMMRQLDNDPEPLIAKLPQRLDEILVGKIEIESITGWNNPGKAPAEKQKEFDELLKTN
jgi:nitroimidazol reductase NimA-like FMN-containing flavoprotein (pyridoxamine 5'-phosphate oxidase superfamily)